MRILLKSMYLLLMMMMQKFHYQIFNKGPYFTHTSPCPRIPWQVLAFCNTPVRRYKGRYNPYSPNNVGADSCNSCITWPVPFPVEWIFLDGLNESFKGTRRILHRKAVYGYAETTSNGRITRGVGKCMCRRFGARK